MSLPEKGVIALGTVFSKRALAKIFFYFALVNAILAFLTQRGLLNQVDTNYLIADPVFYFLFGMLLMMGGIYLNTEQDKHMF